MKKLSLITAALVSLSLGTANAAPPNAPTRKPASARAASGGKASPARAASGAKSTPARAATGAKSSARAATGAKGPARAASASKSSARAAVTSKRAAGVRKARALRLSARSYDAGAIGRTRFNAEAKKEEASGNACPVGQTLKKEYADDGKDVYFVSPTEKCDAPENAEEKPWTKELGVALPSSWIEKEDAVVFACDKNFVMRADPSGKTYCLDTDIICPLDVPLAREKKDEQVVIID
ncbi:MAG: hypothetical protein LBL52_01160, partial [Rickettsiales bacterium]|nr:hypothetical protein [Rickettsiales bacterium]